MIYQLNSEYYVRALRAEDLDGPYPAWFEDQEVCRFNSHGKFFKSASWFRDYLASLDREDRVVWAVCHVTDGHIGNVSLQSMSFINRTAELAILMGDRRHWRKGVSTLASRQLLEHGFLKLNLHRIYCGTAASNVGMRRLAAAMGMTHEGTLRSHVYLDGKWEDVLQFGVLRSEFPERVRA